MARGVHTKLASPSAPANREPVPLGNSPTVVKEAAPAPQLPVIAVDSFAFLKVIAEVSTLVVAFSFIGGWSYLAAYFRTFGLNPLELDVSVPVVCTLAVYVLYGAKWPLGVVAAIILTRVVFARQLRPLGRGPVAAMLGLLFLTAAAAGLIRGRQLANEDALLDSLALPYIAFASKLEKIDQPSCVEFKTYGSLDCKLLLHSKNTYYFFQPVPRVGEGTLKVLGSLSIYTLSDSDVISVHVQKSLNRNARIE